MAIVEDEVRNESEEENDIEVLVEYEGEPDSEDSEDDDDAVDEALERKVAKLELQIKADPYAYDDHIELVKALWALSDLERWRAAFDRVIKLMSLTPEDWLLRLRTEISLSHSAEAKERVGELFQQAVDDCYSIDILSEWCSWCLDDKDSATARRHLKRVVECAGADPLSGKVFWDALFECEKVGLEAFRDTDTDNEEYQKQRERVCRSLEEAVSRPLLRGSEAWPLYEEYAIPTPSYGPEYVARTKKDHELALEYLNEITPYEDRLLTAENPEEKLKIYEEYIEAVKGLLKGDKYTKRDGEATLRVLYDRATTECPSLPMLQSYARHVRECFSTASYRRVVRACCRRWPRTHHFWTLLMQQAERDQKGLDEVNTIFEAALLRGLQSYKECAALWLSYVEYKRRQSSADDVQHMRNTFRLAWDSLATLYGDEANDCEIPLFWARYEYQHMCPKEGKEVFEEIFRYGENRTMSKYWETHIRLEMNRSPPLAEDKLRALFRRALKAVTDYPPAIVTLWTDYERDHGKDLEAFVECTDTCEQKIVEWREYYKTMKDKMTGKKQNPKQANKKNKFDKNKNQQNKDQQQDKDQSKKHNDKNKVKGKRKSDENEDSGQAKKKKEDMEVDEPKRDSNISGVKRSHVDDAKDTENKRQKVETEDSREMSREACTLFVSNLDFRFDEKELRENLSQYGDIVHFRVRKGTKAFGGAICYCQYKNIDCVENALKHDRSLLGGRPMFFSRYAAKKERADFKYATTQEKNKLFVKNLPFSHCTRDKLNAIFEPHGKLKDIRVVTQKDGKPRGLAYVDYEDEASAAAAIEHTNGMLVGERKIEVAISAPPPKADAPASLGLPKRDASGGMRRTQLSSFIPSVLQRASTSKAEPTPTPTANGAGAGVDTKPKSNSDFRTLLLGKSK